MYCILITIPWFLCNKRFKYDIDLDPDSDEQGDDDDDDDEDICSYPLATTALDEEEGDNGPLISFHIEGVVESDSTSCAIVSCLGLPKKYLVRKWERDLPLLCDEIDLQELSDNLWPYWEGMSRQACCEGVWSWQPHYLP